jgi:transcriptional regulator with XRE-family HTH domain
MYELCSNCGERGKVVRGDYRLEELGLPVELKRIELIKCSECGNVDPVISNLNGLMTCIALHVVASDSLLDGREVRFLRKYVGKSAQEFSCLLHIDHTHLSKIENDKLVIGAVLDKLVRLLVISLSPDLKDTIDDMVKKLPNIEDSEREKPEIQIDPAELKQYQCA